MGPVARGVTLIETAAGVCIAGVLTCVGVALAQGMTTEQHDTRNIANLGQTMADFAAWSGDHQDAMPNAGLPGDPNAQWFYGELWNKPGANSVYPGQIIDWVRVLEHWLGARREHWHSTYGFSHAPWDDAPRITYEQAVATKPSKYKYSLTMLTRADAWNWPRNATYEGWHESGPLCFTVVRSSQIATPNAKGVLAHGLRPDEPRRWHVAFADGAAALVAPSDATPAAAHFNSRADPSRRGSPVSHTLHGYLGSDF